jgi:ssDNA-binding Zn-finger/Zn-ribbon topoisomerase 1
MRTVQTIIKEGKKMIFTTIYLLTIRCPICDGQYECGHQESEREGCTYDCPECNGLLIFVYGGVLDFHKYLHYANQGQWPIDGKDTGVLNT